MAARRAVSEHRSVEGAIAPVALTLQAALEATYRRPEEAPEVAVIRWPAPARAAFLLGAASASWAIVVGGSMLLPG